MDSSATGFRGLAEWAAPALKDLLPDLSREEQLWLENGSLPAGRGRKGRRRITKQKHLPELPPSIPAERTEGWEGDDPIFDFAPTPPIRTKKGPRRSPYGDHGWRCSYRQLPA